MFVLALMTLMLLADAWWWWIADSHARRLPCPIAWRVGIALVMLVAIYSLVSLLFARIVPVNGMVLPEQGVVTTFIWHLIILPVVAIPSFAWRIGVGTARLLKRRKMAPIPVQELDAALSRRAFLSGIVVVAPPAVALTMAGQAALSKDLFEVNRIDLPLKNLPPALDGLRIAHVSDPHVYSFMSDTKYRNVIRATNDLDADLVLHSGDLINHPLKDLPDGIQMIQQMRGRYGTYCCNGNHDLIESAEIFERDTVRSGINMLLDESRVIEINGHKLQILAPRWVGRDDKLVRWTVENVLPQRRSDAFPILLAHHPHAFDAASDAGIPLTLSGHTHGGQLGITPKLSIGGLMYRYWTGVYRKNNSALVVSNGIGNWFPLRINVPAEIIQITLRRA